MFVCLFIITTGEKLAKSWRKAGEKLAKSWLKARV